MAQPDTTPGDKESAEDIAKREQERAGKKSALAAGEAAEVGALGILREAADGAVNDVEEEKEREMREAYEKKLATANATFTARLKEVVSAADPKEYPFPITFLSQEIRQDIKEVTCYFDRAQLKKLQSALEKESWGINQIYNILPSDQGEFRFSEDARIQMANKGYPKSK